MPIKGLTEHYDTMRAEVRVLVDGGMPAHEAKRTVAERWGCSANRVREITKGIDYTKRPEPLIMGGTGRVEFENGSPTFQSVEKTEQLGVGITLPKFGYVPHTELDLSEPFEPIRPQNVKTYIFTGWEIRVRPDFAFIDCLRQMAKRYNAEMYLAPHYLPDLDYLPPELRSNFKLVTDDLQLNSNLMFRFVETHALAVSPLSGWKGVTDKTQIIPGLIKQLETYPTDKHARQAITTGSVGPLTLDSEHYRFITESSDNAYKKRFDGRWNNFRSQKKTTAIATEFVMPSALIVHVIDDRRFLIRRVTMQTGNDYLFDLDHKFTANKKNPVTIKPSLNVGDTHSWFADPMAMRCTFEQIQSLQACNIIVNDFFDGVSANHHEKDRPFTFRQAPPIAAEVEYTAELLARLRSVAGKGARCIYLHSNHDDFLEKFLDSGEKYWTQNYNYELCVDLQQRRMSTGRHPIELLIDIPRGGFEFWNDREPLRIGKVAVIHGHQTVSGRRVGFIEHAKHFNYMSMNHTHSPAEFRNAVCGGLTGIREMAYTEGSMNGWLHCNTLIHGDGSMQLVPMIDGLWKV